MASLYTTRQLVAAQTAFPPPDLDALNMFFPGRHYSLTEQIAIDKVAEDRDIGIYVSPLVEAKARTADERKTELYTPPSVIELDQVRVDEITSRLPGEDFDTPLSPEARHAAVLAQKRLIHRNRIHRIWIKQGFDALINAQVVVSGPNHPADLIDYSRDPALTITLAGTDSWSNAASNPITFLEQTSDLISQIGYGAVSTTVVMGLKAWEYFSNNPRVMEQLNLVRLPGVSLVTDPGVVGRGINYRGRFGNFDIYTYADAYLDPATKQMTRYLPENAVIIGGADIGGVLAFGGVSLTEAGGTMVYPGEIVPDHFIQKNPDGEFIRDQSRPLVLMVNPNASAAVFIN